MSVRPVRVRRAWLVRGLLALAGVAVIGPAVEADPLLTTLATFDNTNGADSRATLTADGSGNLYGTTYSGGANGDGTVFRVPITGGAITTLATFDGTNGANPRATLTPDGAGNLYGTTFNGGANGLGTVFRVPVAGGAVTTLVTFDGTNGANPCPGLTPDAAGNLYGNTTYGGPSGYGTVFRIAAGGGAFRTLLTFTDAAVGAFPVGAITVDAAGNLYGTTEGGGTYGLGTVFQLPVGGGPFVPVVSFDGTAGTQPYAPVLFDAAGNLFGTTSAGGANGDGTVFEIAAGTNTVTTLATFDGTGNGADPDHAGLIADAAGNLYGTTSASGPGGYGTVFELTGTGFVTVPEPASTAGLLAAGSVALLARRRRA